MAVYTKITDQDVRDHLGDYDIGELQSLKGIAEGVQNSNYLLSTTKGQYILTLYEQMVREEDLPFYIGLMEHLFKSGINCPQPMKNKKGEALSRLCGRPAAVVSFLNGVSLSDPQPDHCKQLGKSLAKMHQASIDFDMRLQNSLSQQNWREFYARSNERAGEISSELPHIMEEELDFLDKNWPRNLPAGVTHVDLFPDNVFFLDDKLTGLIDFYFAANDLLAYDLAICLNAWCFDSNGNFNKEKSAQLIAGYQSVRSLEAGEIENLPILCRGACVRFLVTRIYDWLNVPAGALVTPHDPLEHLQRLKFHRLIKSPSEYGISQQKDFRHE